MKTKRRISYVMKSIIFGVEVETTKEMFDKAIEHFAIKKGVQDEK